MFTPDGRAQYVILPSRHMLKYAMTAKARQLRARAKYTPGSKLVCTRRPVNPSSLCEGKPGRHNAQQGSYRHGCNKKQWQQPAAQVPRLVPLGRMRIMPPERTMQALTTTDSVKIHEKTPPMAASTSERIYASSKFHRHSAHTVTVPTPSQ